MTDDIRCSAIANLELMFSQICSVLDISREELYAMVYEVMEVEEEVIH
jgi:hypothetical protein